MGRYSSSRPYDRRHRDTGAATHGDRSQGVRHRRSKPRSRIRMSASSTKARRSRSKSRPSPSPAMACSMARSRALARMWLRRRTRPHPTTRIRKRSIRPSEGRYGRQSRQPSYIAHVSHCRDRHRDGAGVHVVRTRHGCDSGRSRRASVGSLAICCRHCYATSKRG